VISVKPSREALSRHRRPLACGALVAIAALALAMDRPGFVTSADAWLYDAMLRSSDGTAPSGRVVIVDVDERSLAAVGQWPWPRDVIGELLTRVRGMGASTIALDVVFAEPDRDARLRGRPPQPPEITPTDAALADTLREGRVVIGYAMTFEANARWSDACVLHPLSATMVQPAGEESDIYRASGAVCSLPVLAEAAGASGFLNAAPDSDGLLRRVPLVIALDDRLYPSLALAAVAASIGVTQTELRVTDANTTWLTLGGRRVPLDRYGSLLVRYLGRQGTFTYVSAADVLAGRADSAVFAGKLVFLGATALGTQEDVATPVEARFTGVEVQATVAENLLEGGFVRRPGYASFTEAALVTLAIPAAGVVLWAGVAWGTLAAAIVCGVLWVGAAWLFARGLYLSPLLATASIGLAYLAAVVVRLRDERSRAAAGERQARGQALLAAAARYDLLRKVSHELRTPLTAIAGWAHLLGRGGLSDDQKHLAISTIRRNVTAQTRLIEHLVDTSSLDREGIRLELRPVDLRDVLSGTIPHHQRVFAGKRIRFDAVVDPEPCVVSGDPDRLRQIVDAVLSNAAKFTPDGGAVGVRLGRAGDHAELVVTDSGVGIAPAFLPHVFERFRQQDDMTTRPEGGLGLGLLIVEQLVHMHGGSVTAESKGTNQGATFTVRLPIVSAEA
jgi:signal transduction histidine kinase